LDKYFYQEVPMPNDFVFRTIRRLNLRLILISLTFLLVVVIGLVASRRFIYNLVKGPFPISQADILTLTDPSTRWQYYVTVTGDDKADTGYTYVSTSDSGGETTEAYYHALLIYDRLLLIKAKSTAISNQMTGALVKLTSIERDQVIAPLEMEIPQIKGAFLPMMLDATGFRDGILGLAFAGLVGLASLAGLGLGVYRYFTPQAHPAMKALKAYGELDSVTHDIDLNMSALHTRVGKKIHFISRWLVSTKNGFAAIPYRDIIWSYKKVTQHRTNGIPTGKTYTALVYDRFGRQIAIPGKETEVDQVLENISKSALGTLFGYDANLAKNWKTERVAVAAKVDEVRRNSGIL
jgi:hypothetical protein